MKKTIAIVLASLLVMALTACGAEKPAADYDLNAELAAAESQYAALLDKVKEEDLNQMELNDAVKEMYDLWDKEVTLLARRLSDVGAADAADAQQQWAADREQTMAEAGAQYEGGSIQPMVMYDRGTDLTRARAYELAVQLGALVGQQVEPMPICYEGDYLDTQGGQEIYSELVISTAEEQGYPVKMRLFDDKVALEGTAVEDDGTLTFTDAAQGIAGSITVTDGTAQFTVTASDSNVVRAGDTFDFPEKVS